MREQYGSFHKRTAAEEVIKEVQFDIWWQKKN